LRDADGFEWSPVHANRLVDFFPQMLVLTSGKHAGKPFKLEQWQADYLATLNGWRASDGARRYTESLFATPRKNGKTETGAGLAIYCLCADGEARAQVYSAAKTREQAGMVFEPAEIMARTAPALRKRLAATRSSKKIDYEATGSYYKALASDAGAIHGTNPHCVLFDELHTQTTRDLYDVLKSGQGARTQPLFVSMTTAGHGRETICREVWTLAQNVRDGISRMPRFLPLIYETPMDAAWDDEDVWRVCNPNLGVTVSLDFLRSECEKAKNVPSYQNTFRNLYLNQWTEQAVRWLPMAAWDECGRLPVPDLRGRMCWGALDMSTTTDLTAFAMAFPLDDNSIAIVVHFWRPEATVSEASKRDHVDYREWARQGLLTLTPGAVVDHDRVRADINEFAKQYNVREIAADRWNASQILSQLSGDGFEIVEHGQGYSSMSAPSKEFERLVVGCTLRHGGNGVLRWNASNVAIETDAAGNIKPTKGSSTGRIDGIVASIMACGRAVTSEKAGGVFFVTG
jgi:phage terminase large subunit-like protein